MTTQDESTVGERAMAVVAVVGGLVLLLGGLALVAVGLDLPKWRIDWWPRWDWPPESRAHRTSVRPHGPAWQLVGLLGGTTAAVVATVLLTPSRTRPLRWLSLATAVAGAIGVVVVAPDVVGAADHRDWVRVPLAIGAGALLFRLAILVRLGTELPDPDLEEVTLLPHQTAALERLDLPERRDTTGTTTARQASRRSVKQLVGRWGEGKSHLVQHLDQRYRTRPTDCLWRRTRPATVLVVVDVWKHASESDLHKAIVKRVLAQPALALPWGWLGYPFGMISEMSVRDASFKVPLAKAEVDGSLAMPRLAWQRQLERAIHQLTRSGRTRLVVVLDELDRASDAAAQAAVTLAERSLDRPGVTVVLAFVEDVLPQKIVNPLVDQLDDLRSTTAAVLLSHLEGDRGVDWDAFRDDIAPPSDAAADPGAAPVDVTTALRRAYVRMDGADRAWIRSRTTEKLLDTDRVVLQPLTPADLPEVLRWARISPLVDRLLAGGAREDRLITSAAATWGVGSRRVPPLRVLKAALAHELGIAVDVDADCGLSGLRAEDRAQLLVFMLLVALEAADRADREVSRV